MDETVVYECDGGVARVSMNRPKALNALNDVLLHALTDALERAAADDAVRCVVLRSTSEHFMAGGDLKFFYELLDVPGRERRRFFETFVAGVHPLIQSMRRMPKPLVASVSGATGGFGMSLLLASDLAVAADNSYFTMAYNLIGTSPDGSSSWFLPRTVGLKKAMELALLCERFDAETAQTLGLVNRVVAADRLEAETGDLARALANGPTRAYANTKRLLYRSVQSSLDGQLQAEAEMFADCAGTDDFVEGVRAFVEKRKASFKGA